MGMPPSVILITGIMASGKSTVAQRLAEQLPKSVHLRGDLFRRMIVNGRLEMEADYSEGALAQLNLRYETAATVAEMYFAAGFTVVYQDIIIGDMLKDVVENIRKRCPLYVVVLCPSPDVVAKREVGRGKVGYTSWTPDVLDASLRNETPHLGYWLDSSGLSVDETVDTLLAHLPEAKL